MPFVRPYSGTCEGKRPLQHRHDIEHRVLGNLLATDRDERNAKILVFACEAGQTCVIDVVDLFGSIGLVDF